MKKRGVLIPLCVLSLALSGASASLGADESSAPVVQPWHEPKAVGPSVD